MTIIEKIQKLLDKANSTDNEQEAQTFFNGAQRLMAQNNLETKDIKVSEVEPDTKEIVNKRAHTLRNTRLAQIIARNFKCSTFIAENKLFFVGLPDDIEIASMTFETVHTFLEKRRRQVYKAAQKAGKETKGIREDYVIGFLKGLDEGFKRNVQEFGLIVVTPDIVMKKVQTICGGNKTSIKQKTVANSELYMKGYADGKGFNYEVEGHK